MNPVISFLFGIIAALTPCVIVLIPLLLYRFHGDNKLNSIFLLFFGFIVSYTFLAFFLSQIFNSYVQNGFKMGFGFLFIVLGVLSFFNKINPMRVPFIKNSFLLGIVFALIVSMNPCALPYLGNIIAISNSGLIFINILFFGTGLIMPAIAFAIFGQKLLEFVRPGGQALKRINKAMSLLLVLAGAYLIYSLKNFNNYDIVIVALLLGVTFGLLVKVFLIRNKNIFSLPHVLMFLALLLIIAASIYHCSFVIDSSSIGEQACSYGGFSCPVCLKCSITFGLSIILGTTGIIFAALYEKRKNL